MRHFILEREQLINTTLEEAWRFFSSPENLEELTPDDMGFDIITPKPIPDMYEGQLIEYKVRPILNVPLYWKTEIVNVSHLSSFVDTQLKGPYKLWRHTHTFQKVDGGVLMKDKVEYALPLGIIGRLAHTLFVKRKLNKIFDYRLNTVDKIFARTIG